MSSSIDSNIERVNGYVLYYRDRAQQCGIVVCFLLEGQGVGARSGGHAPDVEAVDGVMDAFAHGRRRGGSEVGYDSGCFLAGGGYGVA